MSGYMACAIVLHQGVSLPVISKLLGHSNLAMTMRYTHLSGERPDRRRRPVRDAQITAAAERIGEAINDMMEGG